MRTLLLLFLFTGLAWANPTSYDRDFEIQLFPDGSKFLSSPQGDPVKTMEMVQELYRIAGPKIGSRFVEPVYLLVLGDLRPYGAWNGFMVDPQPGDDAIIEKLNAYLVPRGYSIHPREKDEKGRVAAFSLRSLAGLEKRTRESKLPWVPRYDRQSGWQGYFQWKKEIYRALPKEREKDAFHFVEGIMLGYPDAAVEHFQEFAYEDWPTTVDATIPSAYTYLNGVPIFNLRARDADEAGVVSTEKQWEKFLLGWYQTPAHRTLEKDARFVAARTERHSEGRQDDSLFRGDGRYAEARRLGFTDHRQGLLPLNSEHERWLSRELSSILKEIERTPDLVEIAKLGRQIDLPPQHLWSWLLRGSFEEETPAGELFQAFSARYPMAFANLYRRELHDRTRRAIEKADSKSPEREGRPLADLLGSAYLKKQLGTFPKAEQQRLFQAVEARKTYAPLAAIITEADQGHGPYAKLLQELRRENSALWKP